MKLIIIVTLILGSTSVDAFGLKGCFERVLFYHMYLLDFTYAPKLPANRMMAVDLHCGWKPCSFQNFLKLIINPKTARDLPYISAFDSASGMILDVEKTALEMLTSRDADGNARSFGNHEELQNNKNNKIVDVAGLADGSLGAPGVWDALTDRIIELKAIPGVTETDLFQNLKYLAMRVEGLRNVGDLEGTYKALNKKIRRLAVKGPYRDSLGILHDNVFDLEATFERLPEERAYIQGLYNRKTKGDRTENPKDTNEKHINIKIALRSFITELQTS